MRAVVICYGKIECCRSTISLKRKGRQVDSSGIHWRRWRQASTSPVNARAVILTIFPFWWRNATKHSWTMGLTLAGNEPCMFLLGYFVMECVCGIPRWDSKEFIGIKCENVIINTTEMFEVYDKYLFRFYGVNGMFYQCPDFINDNWDILQTYRFRMFTVSLN